MSSQEATGTSTDFDHATDKALSAAQKELLRAARAHRVSIEVDRMVFASDGRTTIVHAPITGLDKYKEADFAAGASILLTIVKSTIRLATPNGSYVVKAQYLPKATSGKITITDRNGTAVAHRDLIVRTSAQSATLFPGVFNTHEEIPVITSIHIMSFINGHAHGYVDCSGVRGTLYFEWYSL